MTAISVTLPQAAAERISTSSPSPKLVRSAQQFEAALLSHWLEKMNQSFAATEPDSDPAHDTLSGLGTEAIASAIAERGGIGIAAMILKHLASKPEDNSSGENKLAGGAKLADGLRR